MNFFKRLFGKEEEVSLKPTVGKKAPEQSLETKKIEETPVTQAFTFPDLPKIKMTELVQVLQNLVIKKGEQNVLNQAVNQSLSDFSDVKSVDDALRLVEAGQLEALHLIGEQFGGSSGIENTVFVPVGINQLKDSFDTILENLLNEGKQISFNCQPEYKGSSFVPTKITINAMDKESGQSMLNEEITIW